MKNWNTTPTALRLKPTALPARRVANVRMGPSGLVNSSEILSLDRWVPKVELIQSSMLWGLSGAWSMNWETWSTTSLPMAPRNRTVSTSSTTSTRPVAEPRRHPRRAS